MDCIHDSYYVGDSCFYCCKCKKIFDYNDTAFTSAPLPMIEGRKPFKVPYFWTERIPPPQPKGLDLFT